MRLNFAGERVLAVMAHPDDAELLCAGTLARAKQDGAAIAVCVMCTGDKGLPSGAPVGNLGEVRRREADDAAKVLGAELLWFGCPDGDLVDAPAARRQLVELYRQFTPTLVVAHAPDDYHADHRAASALAEAASWFCASRGHVTESPPMAGPPAVWFADTINMQGFSAQFYVDISDHAEVKRRMLECHHSQLLRGKDKDLAPLMDLMVRQCQARGAQADVTAAEAFRPHQAFRRLRAW
jgi:LmbE family N-acetylglucosaminyl deacetylase